jgi:hypothetical protein
MRPRRGRLLALWLAFLGGCALIAFAQPATAPPAQPTVMPISTGGIENFLGLAGVLAATVYTAVQGLKNLPWTRQIFDKAPNAAVLVNAAASLVAALSACVVSGKGVDLQCAFTAIMVFLGAAGVHLTVKDAGGGNTATPPPAPAQGAAPGA